MKSVNYRLIVAVIIILALIYTVFMLNDRYVEEDYVRIHIRANSDSEFDQKIKLEVRDKVVDTLSPLLAQAKDKEQALMILRNNLGGIEYAANTVLKGSGALYSSKASVVCEEFPTRKYGDKVLKKGEYDAVIITLGEGRGANWWCVAFPPMCFPEAEKNPPRYKSKILEIINNIKNKENKR
jgi:stage II sporulation protein R